MITQTHGLWIPVSSSEAKSIWGIWVHPTSQLLTNLSTSRPSKDAEWGRYLVSDVPCSACVMATNRPVNVLFASRVPLKMYDLPSLPIMKIIGTVCPGSTFPLPLGNQQDWQHDGAHAFLHSSHFLELGSGCRLS